MTASEPNVPFALGTFSIAGAQPFGALVIDDRAVALAALGDDGLPHDLSGLFDHWQTALPKLRMAARRWGAGAPEITRLAVPVSRLHVHAPSTPRQIFGVGANYRKHFLQLIEADPEMRVGETEDDGPEARRAAAERIMEERARSAEPYCFSKLPSSIAGPVDQLLLPTISSKIDWECELAVVIGKGARNVPAEEAGAYIAGYAIANDITARDLVFRQDVRAMGTDWISAKSQPGFTPFGPWVVPAEFIDPYALTIQLSVNGRIMQDESSSDMLISIERQIAYLSSRVQLLPGDVICTGSPAGNGTHYGVFLKQGDLMVASITGLGEQRVRCA